MIENGKKVIDDFWEQRAIDNGDIPGELADPDQLYKTKLSNVLGDSGIVSTGHATPLTATQLSIIKEILLGCIKLPNKHLNTIRNYMNSELIICIKAIKILIRI